MSACCSQRCRDTLVAARDEAIALSSSSDLASDTMISVEHLRMWVLGLSLCAAPHPADEKCHRELRLSWTEALLSWAFARLASAESLGADKERVAELVRYHTILLPRSCAVLKQEDASLDTWTRVAERLRAAEMESNGREPQYGASGGTTEVEAGSAGDRETATSQSDDRTVYSLIGAALLLANRDTFQPTWTPVRGKDNETAVSNRLTGQKGQGDSSPLHCTALLPLIEWYRLRLGTSTLLPPTLAPQLTRCVDTIAYIMLHKVQNGTVSRCYAPLPFLLDAVMLTYPTTDAVAAGAADQEAGNYHFDSYALNGLLAVTRSLYEAQIYTILKNFKKQSKRKAPIQTATGEKVALPTFELLVQVIEPTMDVVWRERGLEVKDANPQLRTLAHVRRSFAAVLEKLLRDWLSAQVRQLCVTSSASVAHMLEAERDKWMLWMDG